MGNRGEGKEDGKHRERNEDGCDVVNLPNTELSIFLVHKQACSFDPHLTI